MPHESLPSPLAPPLVDLADLMTLCNSGFDLKLRAMVLGLNDPLTERCPRPQLYPDNAADFFVL